MASSEATSNTKVNGTQSSLPDNRRKYMKAVARSDDDEIVISGIAGKFPNSHNVEEYKYNLFNKIDMIDEDERRWRHYTPEIPKRAGKIYVLDKFDATFFGVHFKQAHTMDPQTRILLETAYEAVIDAGINPKSLRGTRTGVYVGGCISESEKTWFYEKVSSGGFGITGCSRAMLPNRISYALGLHGPSFLVDTACSSSMYALDNAFTALRSGQIDAAIVGGSNLALHPFVTLQFARLGVLAPDGYCRPFDKDASGYTRSEAINCLFLQRKKDAKRIYCSVVHSKTNCDGFKPEGITYPSGKLQEQLLREFYDEVAISPRDLGFLEAHSTGTIVGDPEECRAIDNVICAQREEPLLVGSVKSNIGHSEAASGICSLIKACFACDSGKIPPNINFKEIKPEISALAEGRLTVVQELADLPKPYIGINSFGFGGANAHALLKAYNKAKVNGGLPEDNTPRLVTWSGRTEEAVTVIFDALEKRPLDTEFVALLHNIQKEDDPFMLFRGYGIFANNDGEPATVLARDVQHFTGIKAPIVWVFSGMGSQWCGMGASLMIIPQFRQSIERCHAVLKTKGLDLINILTSQDPSTFDNILHSFVGIAAIQIGLVDILRTLNIEPDFIIGHSVGELGCGYADGGFTLEQMILAAYYRGKVSLDIEKIKGSMAAIGIGYKKILDMLPSTIDVACHNSSDSCTISGPAKDIEQFVAELKAKDVFAKEVPCSNIAYHSRYIAHMGPQLLKYLQETIENPKERSSKWLSSSVPKGDWEQKGRNLCSAEYHTNNLLSSVLFEETFAMLPNNAITMEIAPHGLLQAILKRSMTKGIHIPLTQRANKNNALFFLTALGKLFSNGVTFPVANLYPKVEFPVSCGTGGISSLIRWDHSAEWFVTKYENMKTKQSGERSFKVALVHEDEEFIKGHIIDGKILVPATYYLQLVWQTFTLMYYGPSLLNMNVEFDDVKFLRATTITANSSVEFIVMIHYGTGDFEITESGTLVVTGRISEIENSTIPEVYDFEEKSIYPMMEKQDFYKELKLRGYHYNGAFKSVSTARGDGLFGRIEWNYNWVTFMDAMMQIKILGSDYRSLLLPTKIRKLRVHSKHHFDLANKLDADNRLFDVYVDKHNNRVVAGGIEMIELSASPVERRKPPGIPVLENYQFLPMFPTPTLSTSDGVRLCVQLALENAPTLKLKVVEVDVEQREPIISGFMDAVEDLPVITGDYLYLTSREFSENDLPGIHVESGSLDTIANCHFIIVDGSSSEITIAAAQKCLVENGYLVIRDVASNAKSHTPKVPANFKVVAIIPIEKNQETLFLLQKGAKDRNEVEPVVVQVTEDDKSFKWLEQVQTAITNKVRTVVYSFNERLNGLIGLVNCIRKEPDGNLVTCFYIDDASAPAFNLDDDFYKQQYSLRLAMNVYRNGQWGSYRHLQLHIDEEVQPRTLQLYGNTLHRGDLSSLRWFEGPMKPEECCIRVVYSSINFRDVMLATGRLNLEYYLMNRMEQNCVLGFEYSGYNTKTKRRVMSMVISGGIASYVEKPDGFCWDVPDHWSLPEAATIPVVYVTVYYSFFVSTDIRKGKSILIHAGTGGVGLAAIRVALAYNLEVFTTCSTPQKKQFLLDTFPQLKESHIGNSRDTSFEVMIQRETKGEGVDFVLNSLAEDKLQASLRCLGFGGHFLEIGKFDMANDTKLGMNAFLREISFHAIFADRLLRTSESRRQMLKTMIDADIKKGIVQPLPVTVFPAGEMEQAFRHLVGGKHMGKVLIQVREDYKAQQTLPLRVIRQVYFRPHLSYVIPGGLGGFGLELADWMILRGARKLVLSSSRGISNGYQPYRITLWKTYGCEIAVTTADITTKDGCQRLLDEAEQLGPVGGIFNLAVVLRDAIFLNQTTEKFCESFAPKAFATKYLDELSRVRCPKLEHFVVFSSVSCGRGNAGQTNYGMANSVMERIIEDRNNCGFPGKAIQWGAVGEVGILTYVLEDKIDMEIGGTLQQRISSCLKELDTLLSVPEPIVCSMVVAEKRVGRSGNENIIETVMNIMGIRDLKSVSLGTTLSEMGMDSLMAVEIKQTLERDFDLTLTPQDLRTLTFQKLHEYENERVKDTVDSSKLKFSTTHKPLGMELLLRNLGDETQCAQILLPLKTGAGVDKQNTPPTVIVPGLEGIAGQSWYNIGSHMKNNATVLQLYEFREATSVKEIAELGFEHLKTVLQTREPFYIVAYSFGALVGVCLTALLEKAGYRGQLLLIDGAPHFLKKLALSQLGENFTDEILHNWILTSIVNIFFPTESKEVVVDFSSLKSLEEKMSKVMEYAIQQEVYSPEYIEAAVLTLIKRTRMAATFDLESIEQISSPVTLIRSSQVSVEDIEEDYGLSQITKGKVVLTVIEGNHTTMLDNPKLWQLINEFDPAEQDDKEFEKFIHKE